MERKQKIEVALIAASVVLIAGGIGTFLSTKEMTTPDTPPVVSENIVVTEPDIPVKPDVPVVTDKDYEDFAKAPFYDEIKDYDFSPVSDREEYIGSDKVAVWVYGYEGTGTTSFDPDNLQDHEAVLDITSEDANGNTVEFTKEGFEKLIEVGGYEDVGESLGILDTDGYIKTDNLHVRYMFSNYEDENGIYKLRAITSDMEFYWKEIGDISFAGFSALNTNVSDIINTYGEPYKMSVITFEGQAEIDLMYASKVDNKTTLMTIKFVALRDFDLHDDMRLDPDVYGISELYYETYEEK